MDLHAYRRVFLAREGLPLRVEPLPGKGVGVLAAADVDEGVCILAEAPIALVQTRASRAATLACDACLCPLSAAAAGPPEDATRCTCGLVYCSVECLRRATASGHALLCPAALGADGAEALLALYELIDELPSVGESFTAAVRVVAASAVARLDELDGPLNQIDANGNSATLSGTPLWHAAGGLAGVPWWDTLRLTAPLREEARAVTDRVFALLLRVFGPALPEGLDVAGFANLVGSVRQNAIEAKVPPPDDAPKELEDATGIALQLVFSAANHSCTPNCSLQTGVPWPELRGWAVLQTLRALVEGEEITIAYVPPSPGRHQELLEQWGFECDCEYENGSAASEPDS